MTSTKLKAGEKFPKINVRSLNGENIILGNPSGNSDWQMVVVYRGYHCPMCTKYLNELEEYKDKLLKNNIEVVAVSGDRKEQLEEHLEELNISFPIYYGLSLEQMKTLGVYISTPRSENETDHNFSEPALFVINENGLLHVVDISNNPFFRPELKTLSYGLKWIRDPKNNYPIRGIYNS